MEVKNEMPSKGLYIFLLILGFLLGLLWGALSVSPFANMSKAIEAGNTEEAWTNANKIKKWVSIGVAVNVIFFVVSMMMQ